MKRENVKVDAVWDEDALVWVATGKNLPGLVVEAASLDQLAEEVKLLVPQLLALQNQPADVGMQIVMSERLVMTV